MSIHAFGIDVSASKSVREAISMAGLDWNVYLENASLADGTVLQTNAVRRFDNNKVIGEVGKRWTPLQNNDAFQWFQPFVDSKLAEIKLAGCLHHGKKIFIMAEINFDPCEIVKGDFVRKYILLSNAHDGSLSVRVGFTPFRVWCFNMLSRVHKADKSNLIRVRHNANVKIAVDKLRDIMNVANQEFEATAAKYRFLASKGVNDKDLAKYVKVLMGADDDVVSTRKNNICDEVFKLIDSGAGNAGPNVHGTWWAAYNGVNEYLNHYQGRNVDNRLNSLWYGQNAALNDMALENAMQFANAS